MPSSKLPRNAKIDAVVDVAELNLRDREILRDVIRTYIASGEPVSSRTISKHSQHSLSAASIRNVMADLEDAGLLSQPHTSAGRVPTQNAYRLYVEYLMRQRDVPAHEKRYIEEHLSGAASDAEKLMAVAGHLLSDLSHQVGIVLIPAVEDTVVKAIDFVPVGHRKVLCVVVATGGFIDHVAIDTEKDMSREEFQRISNYVTDHFAGMTLREIRDRLIALMSEERASVDRWLARAIELARLAVDGAQDQNVLVEGTSTLIGLPELANVERIRRMLDTFADKARLVTMLTRCLATDGVRVFIGEDSDVTSELDFSLVATSYGIGQRTRGSLGIIGPSRMEYPRIVPLVRFLAESLSKTLSSANRE